MKTKNLLRTAFFCLVVGIGLISFRNGISGFSVVKEEVVYEDYKKIGLYNCETDDCGQVIAENIKKTRFPDCALYDVDLESIINSLKEKPYRLVSDDGSNIKIAHKSDDKKQLMHNKFCVLDEPKRVITGSFNPKNTSLFKDYNSMIVIESDYLFENYKDEFEELWAGKFGSGDKVRYPVIQYGGIRIENYFCPDDGCRDQLLKILDKGNKINFLLFSFTDKKISDRLKERFSSGAKINGVVEKRRINMLGEKYKELKDYGMDVRADSNKYLLHDKTWIINDEIIVIGSYNPTGSGNSKNDENILIIYDKNLAAKMLNRFDRIYNESQSI